MRSGGGSRGDEATAPGARGALPVGALPVCALLAALLAAAPLAAPLAAQSGAEGGEATGDDAAVDTAAAAPARSATDPAAPAPSAEGGLPARAFSPASPWLTRGAGFAMLVATDVGLRRAVQDLRRAPGPLSRHGSVGEEVAEFGNGLGAWRTSLPWLAAGSVAVGAVADGMRGAGRGLSILGGVAAGSMASLAVNHTVGRSRPDWEDGLLSFDPFSGHASFPSGHVSLAFSVAGGVDAATDGWLPATAAYAVAGTTAFARLYDDKHWLSDVVVGAALSATVSRLATRRTMELLGVGGDDGGSGEDGAGEAGSRRDGAGAGPAGATGGSRGVRARLLFTPSLLGVQLRF